MIYFDHAAAEPVPAEVLKCCENFLQKYSGNIESAHAQGYALRKELEQFDQSLFEALLPAACQHKWAVFYGNNAAELFNAVGYLLGGDSYIAWSSGLEHPVMRKMLTRSFAEVQDFTLDAYGIIRDFPAADARVRLVVIPWVQSEIGVKQDVAALISVLRKKVPDAVILLDAAQASFYQYPADAPLPDLMFVSGSKYGVPGGAVLLACGANAEMLKKGFEKLRKEEYLTGRNNMFQSALMVAAITANAVHRAEDLAQVENVSRFLRRKLDNRPLPNGKTLRLTVPEEYSAGNILHIQLPGYQSGVLVRMFSAANIMVAAGSACQSETKEPSAVLTALGLSKNDAFSGLRLSFAGSNTLAEAEEFVRTLETILQNY